MTARRKTTERAPGVLAPLRTGWFNALYPGTCTKCSRPFPAGARAAEAKYQAMCAFRGRPVGQTQWRSCEWKGQPDVQDLYVTHPEREFHPDQYTCADEIVTRVEVQP